MSEELRDSLRADCSRCAGLCCVVPGFTRSADFAIDKPAGQPCPNLAADVACTIHPQLRERGFPGCAVFDCFGAGQHVVQVVFAGQDRQTVAAPSMSAVFGVLRQLHELLWYLAEGLAKLPPGPVRAEVEHALRDVRHTVGLPASDLEILDATAQRARFGPLLSRVSETLRSDVPRRGRDRAGADLVAADLRTVNLRGSSLRGAYLLGADLRDAELDRTDLLGADLRAADLRGARLRDALFLTQPQVNAARGDGRTRLPPVLTRPAHWPAADRVGDRRPGGGASGRRPER